LSSPFLGEIRLFSFNFAPKGWAFCNGALLAINQYTALFSLLGTYYGGNGIQNFALPDLRSRVPLHMGSSPYGSYTIGEQAGEENVTLLSTQLPAHNHMLRAINAAGNSVDPIGNGLAQSGTTNPRYASGGSNVVALNPASIQPAGGNLPHSNIQPYLSMNYCIAMVGLFPSRG
jgi:microcystin-dependent protein